MTGKVVAYSLGILLAVTSPEVAAQAIPTKCLTFEPDTVVVRGALERDTFPGRPNYESIADGDEAETGFYLRLSAPVCFHADSSNQLNSSLADISFVQLNLDSVGYAHLRPYLGQTIAVRGRAYEAFSGHHHAPVVLLFDGGPLPDQH